MCQRERATTGSRRPSERVHERQTQGAEQAQRQHRLRRGARPRPRRDQGVRPDGDGADRQRGGGTHRVGAADGPAPADDARAARVHPLGRWRVLADDQDVGARDGIRRCPGPVGHRPATPRGAGRADRGVELDVAARRQRHRVHGPGAGAEDHRHLRAHRHTIPRRGDVDGPRAPRRSRSRRARRGAGAPVGVGGDPPGRAVAIRARRVARRDPRARAGRCPTSCCHWASGRSPRRCATAAGGRRRR